MLEQALHSPGVGLTMTSCEALGFEGFAAWTRTPGGRGKAGVDVAFPVQSDQLGHHGNSGRSSEQWIASPCSLGTSKPGPIV